MRSLIIGLCVGVSAGIIDIAPMLARKMPPRPILSAFLQWLALGLVIAHLRSPLPSWANGLAAGLLLSLPIAVLIAEGEPGSVPIVVATSTVLGILCGVAVGLAGAA
jgi:hypothetical protein